MDIAEARRLDETGCAATPEEEISHCATDGPIQAKVVGLAPQEVRERLLALEGAMYEQPQVEIETTHCFMRGIYARQIVIPKGVLATSKIHLFEHMALVPKGDIAVLADDGTIKRVKGPTMFVSPPGRKLLGYALEETIWIAIEPCVATEPEAAELELTAATFEEFMERKQALPEGEQSWPLLPQQL